MTLRDAAAITGILLVTLVVACAGAANRTTPAGPSCSLGGRDSVFAVGKPVYRDCAVERRARLTATVPPDYRPAVPRTGCYSVDVEFVVDTLGKPELATAQIVRTNDQAFADAVFATLGRWKYEPAMRGGTLVRQIVNEHRSGASMLVVVPAGSGPPPKPSQRPPSC